MQLANDIKYKRSREKKTEKKLSAHERSLERIYMSITVITIYIRLWLLLLWLLQIIVTTMNNGSI